MLFPIEFERWSPDTSRVGGDDGAFTGDEGVGVAGSGFDVFISDFASKGWYYIMLVRMESLLCQHPVSVSPSFCKMHIYFCNRAS